ncbi:MAG TPA: hypothetical protein VMG10_12990 [Gemmataceae bacterium]|nr:hypothetical protein [Gemmataceae bacterium]
MAVTKEKRAIGSEELQDVVFTRVNTEASVLREEGGASQDPPGCADEATGIRETERASAWREAWEEVIDHMLIAWGCDPEQLEDEGIDPPTRKTILRAIRLAQAFRDEGRPAPDSVVPDPNKGIVFERRDGDVSEVLYLWEDGTTEYQLFLGTRLVERRTL